MKSVSITGALRENKGTSDAKKVRREGKVPCVLYGGAEQVHFLADTRDFKQLIYTPEVHQVKVNLNGKEYNTLLKDVQYHPVTDAVIHADFLELADDKAVSTAIPVKVTGNAPGVIAGGKLQQKLRKVKVKALPGQLPDFVHVDISKMQIGDSIKAGALSIDNVEILDSANAVVVAVKTSRAAASAKDAAAGAAPEAAKEGEAAEGEGKPAEGASKE